jgi:hypothetical protein
MGSQIIFSRSKSHGPTVLTHGIPVIGPLPGGALALFLRLLAVS